jgi:hypothetical protein
VKHVFAFFIIAGTVIAAGVRVSRVDARREQPTVDDPLAHALYAEVTDKEVEERRDATLRFQGSPWSQQDDFHAKERDLVHSVAASHGVTTSSVVDALDRGMRERWTTRAEIVSQRVIPCRPRLEY